jgi:hypothetical protein
MEKLNNQELTSEQLAEKLSNKVCCENPMSLEETHDEGENRVCYKYSCSHCNNSLFTYGEKPKKSITLTTQQYEGILAEIKNIYQILYQAKSE